MPRYRTWLADSGRWDGFEFRPDDIVISTPSKCGTTWMQMICALLIFGDAGLPGPLTELSPWLDIQTDSISNVFAALAAQRHRRFIKTHTPLDGLPLDERVTYICVGRDPRDVAISSDHHLDNMNREVLMRACETTVGFDDPRSLIPAEAPERVADPVERFRRWVEEAAPPSEGLELTLHHLGTFWARRQATNVVLVHYDDLQADLEEEMRRLAERLEIVIEEELWPGLVAGAKFDRMRDRAAKLAPQVTMAGLWRDAGRFFNRGTSGQWQTLLGSADLDRYWARVRRLAPPDLVAWTHQGWRGTARPYA
ncbi:MAG TPA: sulfotransferase domain-containing protein [Streptosporangiaceae bacterium]